MIRMLQRLRDVRDAFSGGERGDPREQAGAAHCVGVELGAGQDAVQVAIHGVGAEAACAACNIAQVGTESVRVGDAAEADEVEEALRFVAGRVVLRDTRTLIGCAT